jgi:hypothetical protein
MKLIIITIIKPILLMKSQLVTSYTLKHDVNRCFWNPAGQNVNMYNNSKHYIHSIFINTYDNYRVCFKNTALRYPGCWPNIFDRSSTYLCSVKLDFSISYKESGFKIITINWNIAIFCIYEWIKCCPKRQKYWWMID